VTDQTTTSDRKPATDRSTRRRGWLLAFLGFMLCIGAWSVAAPYDGTPDEQQHILRAASVAAGQVAVHPANEIEGGGAFVTVPSSLVRDRCWQYVSRRPAGCTAEPGGARTPVRAISGAGRYHPIYYAVVGLPLRLWPDWTGVLLARLISGALCAALFATALMDALRWSRHRLMAVAILVGVSPMATHMASAVNPNGVEIAAGVALFAAAVPLLFAPGAERSRTLLWHVGVAALTLAVLRAGGPLWVAVSVAALLLPLRWAKLRQLWAWRPVRWWTLVVGLAMVGSLVWTALFKTTNLGDFTHGQRLSLAQAIGTEVDIWREYADEMVGVMAWLDARMPGSMYLIWESAVAALLVWGFIVAHRAGRWRMAALAAGGLGIPFVMQIAYVNKVGFVTQGRYLLPVAVGLPILATFLIQEYGLPGDKSRTLLRLYIVTLLPIHLVALVFTMVRWQRGLSRGAGLRGLNPLSGSWQPPLGPVLPLVATIAGLLLIGWLLWRPERVVGGPPPATATDADAAATDGAATDGAAAGAQAEGDRSRHAAALAHSMDGASRPAVDQSEQIQEIR
jgi:Predicted membrane protein (DUF2142)